MKKPVYLDYAATTPVDPRVIEKILSCLGTEGDFGNPASSSHPYGHQARARIEHARTQVANLINAKPEEIIWTSGATESDNLAILGVAKFHVKRGRHIITSKIEHKAILDTCKQLAKEGYEITYLLPQKNGLIDLEDLKKAIRPDTILISTLHVNNEIGVAQDIQAIGRICREQNILFHVDAAQSAGKIAIDVQAYQIDLLSLSAHKCYGPKGIGALYVRQNPPVRISPLIHGGGHERGYRSGTLATHQIVGMGEAFALLSENFFEETQHLKILRDRLWQGIRHIPGLHLNSDLDHCSPNHLNISIEGVEGGALLMALPDIAISSGSACTSAAIEPSYVLVALGVPSALAHSTLRITVGRFTTEAEIDFAVQHITHGIEWLRNLSPVWNKDHV